MQRMTIQKGVLCFFSVLVTGFVSAQEKKENNKENDTIGTEHLIIIKPYSPSVSDAFKVKQTPRIPDSVTQQKKQVDYNILPFPVASTFTPAKGRATSVQRKSMPRLYDNYAALGFGNYSNIFADFYSNFEIDRYQNLAIALNHNSSQGGIEGVPSTLDDKYYDTSLDLDYNAEADAFNWGASLGFQHQVYNWYGIPNSENIASSKLDAWDTQHTFYAVTAGANIKMNEGFFEGGDLTYRRFGDNFSSGEDHVLLTPGFKLPTGESSWVNLDLSLDFLNGDFDKGLYDDAAKLNYNFLNVGATPSIQLTEGDLVVDLGAQFVYSLDSEHSENNFYIYPKVKGSYRIWADYFIFYAGAEGGLIQNTYYDLAQENPYVSPTLGIRPTDKQYNIYAGTKGKFTENISYDLNAGYTTEKYKPLFLHNMDSNTGLLEGYEHGNSFGVVYDDVNTISISGELKTTVSEKLALALKASFNHYSTDKEGEAWNLPDLKASLTANYNISKRWFLGASLFYTGERDDLYTVDYIGPNSSGFSEQKVTLDGFVDANLRLGFKVNDQLSFFVRGNNLFGDNYERWFAYPVQGIQVMGGASYQFDF